MAACSFCLLAIEIWPGIGARSARSGRAVGRRERSERGGQLREPCARSEAEAVALARSEPQGDNRIAHKGKQTSAWAVGPSYSAAPQALQLRINATIAEMGLRQTRRGWEEPRPSRCPECAGELGANQVPVGVTHCRCGRMHRSHSCRHCEHTIYTPPLDDSCESQSLDGR